MCYCQSFCQREDMEHTPTTSGCSGKKIKEKKKSTSLFDKKKWKITFVVYQLQRQADQEVTAA